MRIKYLDRMRAFWVGMMVIDHGLQGYALTFGAFWFFMDTQRTMWCDVAHVFFNALLMPPLFLIAGLWVVPHLQKYGTGSFLKKRFYRLGLPFLAGVVFLVPMMTFPEYHTSINPYDSYTDFWTGPFIWSALQAGPFWFLSYLLVLTLITAVLAEKAPRVLSWLKSAALWTIQSPYKALGIALIFFALLQSMSDLVWGAPYWISWRKAWDPYGVLVAVQGSRFLLQGCYFFMGVGLGQTQALAQLQHHVNTGRVSWKKWCLLGIVLGIIYVSIAQPYDPEGAHGHRMTVVETVSQCHLWPIMLRTTLQPTLCLLATLVGFMVFMRFENPHTLSQVSWKTSHTFPSFWGHVTPYAYGVYFIHEIFTVGVHYGLSDTSWPLALKIFIASFGVLVWSWACARWVLPRLPLLGKIFHNGS